MNIWRKIRLASLKRKMNGLFAELLSLIDTSNRLKVEFGNIRKGNSWHVVEDDRCIYSIEIDLLSVRPLLFSAAFEYELKEFVCSSHMGSKNELNHLLQFRTDSFAGLRARLLKLAESIPDLRERMIKEYMFNQAENRPKRRWLRFFRRSKSKEEYLQSVLVNLHQQGKISNREVEQAKKYIKDLL